MRMQELIDSWDRPVQSEEDSVRLGFIRAVGDANTQTLIDGYLGWDSQHRPIVRRELNSRGLWRNSAGDWRTREELRELDEVVEAPSLPTRAPTPPRYSRPYGQAIARVRAALRPSDELSTGDSYRISTDDSYDLS